MHPFVAEARRKATQQNAPASTTITTEAPPQMIGVDVTGMSDKQIEAMEARGKVSGVEIDGVLFPEKFTKGGAAKPKIFVRDTKHNKELFEKYGAKAFLKDGSINYSTLADVDILKEMKRVPGVSGTGKFAKPKCWKVLKQLNISRLPRLVNKLPMTKMKEKTLLSMEKAITAYVERGTPEAMAKLKRKSDKKRKESATRRQIRRFSKDKEIDQERKAERKSMKETEKLEHNLTKLKEMKEDIEIV